MLAHAKPVHIYVSIVANPSGNKNTAKWNDRFFELIECKAKHGHCNVPRKYKENKGLGISATNMTFSKKGKTSQITEEREERIAKLEEIEFKWKGRG